MSENKAQPKPLKNCHDCGRFVEKRKEQHPLCRECASLYDSPWDI